MTIICFIFCSFLVGLLLFGKERLIFEYLCVCILITITTLRQATCILSYRVCFINKSINYLKIITDKPG